MSLESEQHINGLLGSSVKKEKDEPLFLELTLRGYDLTKFRDKETRKRDFLYRDTVSVSISKQ